MTLLHQGFDKLEMTLQGTAPGWLRECLKEAKQNAVEKKQAEIIQIGAENRRIKVRQNGSNGGYGYLFDIGEENMSFAIKESERLDGWNVRVFITSLKLATDGFAKTLEELQDWLHYLELVGPTGERGVLAVSLSRVDFCCDFLLPQGYAPEPEAFVFHSNAKKGMDFTVEGNSKSCHSIRIGKMPNKQVAVYDKRKEAQQKGKNYWFDIWGISKKSKPNVWRFEFRSGKEHLKKFEVRTLDDFQRRISAVMLDIHKTIRYVTPQHDTNRSRWPNHPLWDEIGALLENMLDADSRNITYRECLPLMRDDKEQLLMQNILGCGRRLAAMQGYKEEDSEAFFEALGKELYTKACENPDAYRKKFLRAQAQDDFSYRGKIPYREKRPL